MAAVKKFAGLPDVDEGAEIYETSVPDLTEASTLPTESASDSDEGEDRSNLDREELDVDAARSRFEPSIVSARHANFSDTISGGRRDYQIRSRRRRQRRIARPSGLDEDLYESEDSDQETLQGRLARLQREAAELQAEIEKVESEKEKNRDTDGDSDYEDTVDHQTQHDELLKGVHNLSKDLNGLAVFRKKPGLSIEEEFIQKLDIQPTGSSSNAKQKPEDRGLSKSSISAIAEFSDRLTILETALGVSSVSQATSTSILPTLDALNTQIETLYSTLIPRSDDGIHAAPSTNVALSTGHLDPLAQKIRYLITESKRLEDSRRAATKSFEELLETRDRHAHLISSSQAAANSGPDRLARTASTQDANDSSSNGVGRIDPQSQFTPLFLDNQASRISALYSLLPTIQQLQPLLPVVLERLRALNIVHNGAAEVRAELDEVENRLDAEERQVEKWRKALENAEAAMNDGKEVIKENVKVVGSMVKSLETRVKTIDPKA